MPSKKPDALLSGVLRSPWASNQRTAVPGAPMLVTAPMAALQLPERTTGRRPAATAPRQLDSGANLRMEALPEIEHRGLDVVSGCGQTPLQTGLEKVGRPRAHPAVTRPAVVG